ncbi:hypothetical protein BD65_2701 [Yersinia ruckeri]|uniref:winged helix-turn-helix domain-containing protein n=1 Tax=Yersinia ruckeri TaxID=29486 RepID=UPI0005AC7573|nr:histidine kinase [Yersinia ruckeri]AJI94134.1 hypothetical protein BD65_2701 [Yersinia ruckeri]MCW6566918.1 hypothetical protein [Yersinia ruckeri]
MLMREECIQLLSDETLTYKDIFTLQCSLNKLIINSCQQTISLNEGQKRLLVALLKGINCKRQIINLVWYENHQRISDNNYHQLIFQLRALLQRYNIAGELIVTIPNYGLKLNENLLITNSLNFSQKIKQSKKKGNNIVRKSHFNSALTRIFNLGRSFFTP